MCWFSNYVIMKPYQNPTGWIAQNKILYNKTLCCYSDSMNVLTQQGNNIFKIINQLYQFRIEFEKFSHLQLKSNVYQFSFEDAQWICIECTSKSLKHIMFTVSFELFEFFGNSLKFKSFELNSIVWKGNVVCLVAIGWENFIIYHSSESLICSE